MDTGVLIVGAGPAGLTLGAELALCGVPCRILEQRAQRSPYSRAFGLQPRSMEILDTRGQAEELISRGLRSPVISLGSEGRGIDMTGRTDSTFEYMLIIPQVETENVLEQWALKEGAVIEREAEVVGLRQDGHQVEVQVRTPHGERVDRAAFVVGCDGARSTVRGLLGLSFTGSRYDFSAIIADVRLAAPPAEQVFARHSHRGMVAVMPFPDGHYRIMIQDHDRMQVPITEPVTLAEVRRSAQDILGVELGIEQPRWMNRFRSEQRLAERYRVDRVFLAGDAAHVHTPAGGQGLNLGIQDAVNLGWKLAAAVQGWAPDGLLDSYEAELRPIAEKVLKQTDSVFRFNTAKGLPMRAVRWSVKQALLLPALQTGVIRQLAGTQTRYRWPGPHPRHRQVGRRVADRVLMMADTPVETRLFDQFRTGHSLLLDSTADGRFARLTEQKWPHAVRGLHVAASVPALPEVVVIRPDGHAVYASDRPDDAALDAAVAYWCGPPVSSSCR